MTRQIITVASITWCCSVFISLFYTAIVSGRFSVQDFLLPGVLPIALFSATVVSVFLTPLVMWVFKNNYHGVFYYGGVLLILLMIYIALVAPNNAAYGLYGSILLGIIGLIVIGVIRRKWILF